jgi:hypothetical protein
VRTAIVAGVEVEAKAGAPQKGRCAACGGKVALWNHPRGGYYYRHVAGAGKHCRKRVRPFRPERLRNQYLLVQGNPELTLAVRITRVASADALNGDAEALAWLLEHPLPRMTLEELGIDADVALEWMAARVRETAPAVANDRLSAQAVVGPLAGAVIAG